MHFPKRGEAFYAECIALILPVYISPSPPFREWRENPWRFDMNTQQVGVIDEETGGAALSGLQ